MGAGLGLSRLREPNKTRDSKKSNIRNKNMYSNKYTKTQKNNMNKPDSNNNGNAAGVQNNEDLRIHPDWWAPKFRVA